LELVRPGPSEVLMGKPLELIRPRGWISVNHIHGNEELLLLLLLPQFHLKDTAYMF